MNQEQANEISKVGSKRSEWENFKITPPAVMKPDYSLLNFQCYTIYKALIAKSPDNKIIPFVISSSTGSGKTLMGLTTYFLWRQQFPNTRLHIFTLASVVRQFHDEIYKFFDVPDLHVVYLHDGMTLPGFPKKDYPSVRKEAYMRFSLPDSDPRHIDVLVENYHLFRNDIKEISRCIMKQRENGLYNFVIFDEIHCAQNEKTKTFKCVETVRKISTKCLGLTATISMGKCETSYGILKSLGINLAPSRFQFLRFYTIQQFNRFTGFWSIVGYKNLDKLKQVIDQFAIILRKPEIADFLPAFTPKVVLLPQTQEQINMIYSIYAGFVKLEDASEDETEKNLVLEQDKNLSYEEQKELEKEFRLNLTDEQKEQRKKENLETLLALVQIGHIKRALQNPLLVTKTGINEETMKFTSQVEANKFLENPDNKIKEIVRIMEDDLEQDSKVFIYTPSRIYANLIEFYLRYGKDVPERYRKPLKITGEIPVNDRKDLLDKVRNTDDHNVIIANEAGTTGINAEMCNVMIVTSMPQSSGALVQLVGRISRVSSRSKSLLLYYLLHQDSQDLDTYESIQRQLILLEELNGGEIERGLRDSNVREMILKEQAHGIKISDETQIKKLTLHKIQNRYEWYIEMVDPQFRANLQSMIHDKK